MDCATHHREYGTQISFIRSLTLDEWNKKQLLFMEMGGNHRALEFFKKHGLKPDPHRGPDYKSAMVQNYKRDLVKKVEAELEQENILEQAAKASAEASVMNTETTTGSHRSSIEGQHTDLSQTETPLGDKAKPDHEKGVSAGATKTSGGGSPVFVPAVSFTANTDASSSAFFNKEASGKGMPAKGSSIHAKKIADFDFDSLTPESSAPTQPSNPLPSFAMKTNQVFAPGSLMVNQVISHVGDGHHSQTSNMTNNDRLDPALKKYENSKCISSKSLENPIVQHPVSLSGLEKATAISSTQVFGDKENSPSSQFSPSKGLQTFFMKASEKVTNMKEGASNLIHKWQQSVDTSGNSKR
eukprot:TRINITY_DN3924_c0_g2_i2.p1 TRINITY_DN3924_c0_g2~~TRINITY_DN3924_c0_g2_i2.p1  ORF type:complete len:355 (-),score=69.60 TRINITY_DN3924_c0_g2_i2:26-1090(-)